MTSTLTSENICDLLSKSVGATFVLSHLFGFEIDVEDMSPTRYFHQRIRAQTDGILDVQLERVILFRQS